MTSGDRPTDITFRRARPGDVERMVTLYAACFDHPWSPESFINFLSDETCEVYIAEFCSSGPGDDLAGLEIHRTVVDEMELLTVCVAARARRQGLGKSFMMHLSERAKDLDAAILFLEVAETNIAAIGLYRKMGFEDLSIRKNYYKDKNGKSTNAIVMKKSL